MSNKIIDEMPIEKAFLALGLFLALICMLMLAGATILTLTEWLLL